jgi:hypothetical protein
MEAKLNRYGHPADHVAALLALIGTLAFAFAWPSANILVCALATGAVVAAGLIVLRRWLNLHASGPATSPYQSGRSSRWNVAVHRK